MIGPHQSIIRFLMSTGHGATPWVTIRRLDRSYLARLASGSRSSRVNMVGTNCACVTLCRSTSAGSNFSITTTVAPPRCGDMDHRQPHFPGTGNPVCRDYRRCPRVTERGVRQLFPHPLGTFGGAG